MCKFYIKMQGGLMKSFFIQVYNVAYFPLIHSISWKQVRCTVYYTELNLHVQYVMDIFAVGVR
jgi:hypothetical protein